jgi:hypothetical protein
VPHDRILFNRDRLTTTLVNSPLYPIMVKKARETMKGTAEGAGIDWEGEVDKLRSVGSCRRALATIARPSRSACDSPFDRCVFQCDRRP